MFHTFYTAKHLWSRMAPAVLIGLSLAAPAQGMRLERTENGGWRFDDEAFAVSLSGETGWPVGWEICGRRVLSGGTSSDAPWDVVSCASDGKGPERGSGRVRVLSVGTVGGNVLESRMEAEGWRVTLRLTLDGARKWASGRFELERTGEDPVRLLRFLVRAGALDLGESGEIVAPAQWPPERFAASDFRDGMALKSRRSGYPVIASDGRGTNVTWIDNQFLPYADHGLGEAFAHGGAADVVRHYYCQGYMNKGDRQTVGDSHILFGAGDVDDALRRLPEWFASVRQTAPADRPDWVKGAVLYSIAANGTRDADRRDGRGFRGIGDYLDAIAALGCDTIWLQPVEDAAPYHPRDYFKLQKGIGSEEDYKAFVAAAHTKGIRVWNDIVPHGGHTNTVRYAEHPEWYAVREDGTVPDYWACDFNWPEWADYMAGVADYWMRLGNLDGFRIDAAGGARYPNWNPSIPYARASFARLQGGFRMQRALRGAVRRVNPDGAILSEADAGVFNAVSDATWDFSFGQNLLPELRERPAGKFVPLLRRWLHERQKTIPPGSLALRYVEIHDVLRARDVYGAAASVALGALAAWIGETVPVISDGRETGAFEELRRIVAIRRAVPELCGGETDYLAPEAPPGVFACLRKGPKLAVPLVNLNGERTVGDVRLPDGRTFKVDLPPLGFTVLRPDDGDALPPVPAPFVSPHVDVVDAPEAVLVEMRTNENGETVRVYRLSGCARWFAHTAEGAFESPCFPPHGDRRQYTSTFYRLPRGGNLIWDGRIHPFGFTGEYARFGGIGRTHAVVASLNDPDAKIALLDSHGDADGLHAEVTSSAGTGEPVTWRTVPAEAVRAPENGTGDSRLKTVVGGWEFDDGTLRVRLQRNGALRGVWRRDGGEWKKLSGAIYLSAKAPPWKYSDAKAGSTADYDQASDVEPFAKLSRNQDGSLTLSIEGVLRNINRSGKMANGTSYRTVYSLGGAAGASLDTSFKTDAASKAIATFLNIQELSDEVAFTADGNAKPVKSEQGFSAGFKWEDGPGTAGRATFSFPAASR